MSSTLIILVPLAIFYGGYFLVVPRLEERLEERREDTELPIVLAILLLMLMAYAVELGILYMMRRRQAEAFAIQGLARLIASLELNGDWWKAPAFRGGVNRQLERIAKHYSKLPVALSPRDSSTAETLYGRARAAAASVRELKVWVAQPGLLTREDLINQLGTQLKILVEGRWYDLSQGTIRGLDRRENNGRRVALVLGSILGAFAVVSSRFSSTLGEDLSAILTGISLFGVVALSQLGLFVPENLVKASDAVTKVIAPKEQVAPTDPGTAGDDPSGPALPQPLPPA